MEALWSRTNPLVRQTAEIAGSGEVGRVRHLAVSFGFAFDGPDTHRLLDPAQAGGAILDLGVYPVHLVDLLLGEPAELRGWGTRTGTGVDAHATATLTYPGDGTRPDASASITCSLLVDLPTRLEVFCDRGSLTLDNFFLPPELRLVRGRGEPEIFVTQWPGGGYTFEAQEVMRCLRAGETQSPLVPWSASRSVARTLDRWLAAVP